MTTARAGARPAEHLTTLCAIVALLVLGSAVLAAGDST